jgi:hypothetical protein
MSQGRCSSTSTRIGAALLGSLLVIGLISPQRAAKAQAMQRRVLTSAPIKVMAGDKIHLACLNGGDKPLGMRFHLVSGATGMALASSSEQIVAPRTTGAYEDITLTGGGWTYGAVELLGDTPTYEVRCSITLLNEQANPIIKFF